MPPTIFKIDINADACRMCNELRKHLIVWAQNQSTGYRTNATIGKTKRNADHNNAKADSFDFMVKYLQGMEIKE